MKTPNLIPPVSSSSLTKVYINPKNNDKIESVLTVGQAKEIIKKYAPAHDSFALDLASKNNLSAGQIYWLILKGDKYNPENKEKKGNAVGIKVGAGFGRIHTMFNKAKESGLKRPKIALKDSIGNKIQIVLAPDKGTNPGFIYVKSNGEYAGKVSPDGEFFPARICSETTKEYLQSFSSNPEMIARQYGRETGNCCFCSRLLTDNRSVSVGYGPVCASTFGLNWG